MFMGPLGSLFKVAKKPSPLGSRLDAQGIRHSAVTLHVGAGTFRPVTAQQASGHTKRGGCWAFRCP